MTHRPIVERGHGTSDKLSWGDLVDDGTGPDPFALSELRAKLREAVADGFTPLLSDPSGRLDSYFAEQGAAVLDAKRAVVECGLGRGTYADALQNAREKVVDAMRVGNTLVVSLQTSAPDFRGRFSDARAFPLELFERAGKGFVGRTAGADRLFSWDDKRAAGGFAECDPDFQVVLTSHFKPWEMTTFLFKQPMFPKRSQFRILELVPDREQPPRATSRADAMAGA